MALQKIDGVEAVELSLNQGLARIELAAGNTVTLARIHELVRNHGFTPKGAKVRLRAEVTFLGETASLSIAGTAERFDVARAPLAAEVRNALEREAGREAFVEGTIPAPDDPRTASARIQVTRIEAIVP